MNQQLSSIYDQLMAKAAELNRGIEIKWVYPDCDLRNPRTAGIDSNWPVWNPDKPREILKNRPNWFYTDIRFPRKLHGISLNKEIAYIMINTYCPFRLWLDGKRAYKENHNWAATGPIADPVITTIKPGRTYSITYCVEPTEVPAKFNPLSIVVTPLPCLERAAILFAFCTELKMAAVLAESKAETERLDEVVKLYRDSMLVKNRWHEVDRFIEQAESILKPLSRKAKSHTIHLVAHNHIDMDWQWTWKDTVYCIRRDAKSALDLMKERPDITMSMSQIPFYQVVKDKDPDLFETIKSYIKQGRWINTAGTWVEGDLNKADGESIARQMQYATDWSLEHLGKASDVLWEPDTFGHPGNMPQLAKLGGYKIYFHWRCNPGGNNSWPVRIWEGIDGTGIFTISSAYGGGLMPSPEIYSVFHNIFNSIEIGLKNSHYIWGCGDHGGGLPRHHLELLEKNRQRPLLPSLKFSTFEDYQAAVLAEKKELKSNRGVTHHLFEGCYTTHALIKRYNRHCESALLCAESMAALAGLNENETLKHAWTGILFNQFHDIFCGAAVQDAYRDAYQKAETALKVSKRTRKKALASLAKVNKSGQTFSVWNPSGFARTEVVASKELRDIALLVDANDQQLPVQQFKKKGYTVLAGIPALSCRDYSCVQQSNAGPMMDVRETGLHHVIDTPHYTVKVSKQSGAMVSYFHKAMQQELVGFGVPKVLSHTNVTRMDLAMNVFQIIDEAPNPMPAWQINDIRRTESLLRGAKVKLIANGPVFACLQVKHKFRHSAIREYLFFYHHTDRIDFDLKVKWYEQGNDDVGIPQLKLSFATALSEAKAHFEGPFSVASYPADGQEQVTQKFVDVTGREFGYTILNDSTYGCDCLGGRTRITLLRNTYAPDPNSDNGVHRFRFAFLPHQPDFQSGEATRAGIAFNRSVICARTNSEVSTTVPGLSIEGSDSVVCTAHRLAEHTSATLLRFFETSGKSCEIRIHYRDGIQSADEVDFQETVLNEPLHAKDGWLNLQFRAFEVKTVAINMPEK